MLEAELTEFENCRNWSVTFSVNSLIQKILILTKENSDLDKKILPLYLRNQKVAFIFATNQFQLNFL